MIYKVTFLKQALKEWSKLSLPVREQLYKKLKEVMINPRIPKNKLSGLKDCYKIKIMSPSYRLVYQVIDKRLVIQVIAVSRRDKEEVYEISKNRLD